MKIHSIKLTNFRGYRNTVVIPFNDLTVFVGKNDVGKSTILEALDIFFHDGKGIVKIERSDINVREKRDGNLDTIISIVFDDLPEQIIIDATARTSLRSEFLLNAEGMLEVIKKIHDGGTPKVYIKAMHPSNSNCEKLLLKKNSELRNIVNEIGIPCDNQNSNVCLRKSIWEYYRDDLQLHSVEIDASKEDAKAIWNKLSTYMPVYSLFQSDRKNSDGDSEIQDPLQEAVKEIVQDSGLQEKFASIANEVIRKLQEVSGRTLEKIQEMDPTIASSLNPVIPSVDSLKWSDVFKKVSISGDEDIPINKRGSGIKRLVLLNFFRAEAERRLESGDNAGIIYAIEEPETSQHSENQKILIQALKEMTTTPNVQVILTTHSGTIVRNLDFENLRLVSDSDGQKNVLKVDPGVLLYPSLNEVNYLAYGEAAEEYHNELYGFLEYKNKLNDYKQGRPTIPYIRLMNDRSTREIQVIRSEYIRHQIHHPDNTFNPKYTHDELRNSIQAMRDFILAERMAGRLDN